MRCIVVAVLLLAGCAAPPVALPAPVAPVYVPPESGLIHSRAGWVAHWPASSFPIRLLVPEAMPPGYDVPIYLAAQTWNLDVGAEVFRVEHVAEVPEPEQMPDGACSVQLALLPGKIAGVTQFVLAKWPHPDPGSYARCHMGVDPRIPSDITEHVIRHELGHVLGLADVDDESSRSVMRGFVPENIAGLYVPADMVDWVRRMMGLEPFGPVR